MEDDLFDNGIDGEPWAECYYEDGANYYSPDDEGREDFDIHNANGLEIKCWPTYGNCTIITDRFHMYWYPGSRILEIIELKSGGKYASGDDPHVLTLKEQDLYFFGDKTTQNEDGKWGIEYYTGEQVNQKIQRYINLRAFI